MSAPGRIFEARRGRKVERGLADLRVATHGENPP